MSQYGTAFFTEAAGGPLAVNAFGTANSHQAEFVGGHFGYEWSNVSMNLFNQLSGITPAIELEGYYLQKSSFIGNDINNDTIRLPEHNFLVTYPLSSKVFLANAVVSPTLTNFSRFHPYVGAGIGAAILSISNADATQLSPAEVGINHYNSNPNSTDVTFAGQIKAGLSFNLNEHFSLFGEYRWLYLAQSDYVFGSTSYPTHAATSNWTVALGSQNYNLGAIGARYYV